MPAPWTESEQLGYEKETIGLYWSGHPVDRYAAALKEFGAGPSSSSPTLPTTPRDNGWGPGGPKPIEPDASVGGIVATCRQLKTRKGDRMAVFTLEDAQGSVEIIALPRSLPARRRRLIEPGVMVLVRGKLERDDENVRILASEIAPIEAVRERLAREVAIRLRRPADRDMLESAGTNLSAPSRRSQGVVRGRDRHAAEPDAGAGGRQLADPRAPVARAHRRSRTAGRRRHRGSCVDEPTPSGGRS